MTAPRRDLIDLAVEYGMVRHTCDFNDRSAKAQEAILRVIRPIAEELGLTEDARLLPAKNPWGNGVGCN